MMTIVTAAVVLKLSLSQYVPSLLNFNALSYHDMRLIYKVWPIADPAEVVSGDFEHQAQVALA